MLVVQQGMDFFLSLDMSLSFLCNSIHYVNAKCHTKFRVDSFHCLPQEPNQFLQVMSPEKAFLTSFFYATFTMQGHCL